MLFLGFKYWLKKEKIMFYIIKNERLLRLYRLHKLKAPQILIDNEMKLVKQTFLNYVFKKYAYRLINKSLLFFATIIFPSFVYSYSLWINYEFQHFFNDIK